tara:strand:+ start:889 stop:2094 length:1206 start_codon:yes stop_codon:yes gene_type:complete
MALTKVTSSLTDLDGGITIDNITIDGTEIDLSSGDLSIDVAGNIQIDADDAGEVRFLDGGTQYATIKKDGNNAVIQSIVADGDLIFQGIDGSSFITPMQIDMSAGGNVGIGAAPTLGALHVTSSLTDIVTFESTNAGTTGAQLLLYHNSSSPADGDRVGALAFQGEDDGGNHTTYSGIRCLASDVSDGSEDGILTFSCTRAGTFTEAMRITEAGHVGIGTTSPNSDLHVKSPDDSTAAYISGGTYAFGIDRDQASGTNYGWYLGTTASNKLVVYDAAGTGRFEVSTSSAGFISDKDQKENITDLAYGLDTVKKLQPKKFKFKDVVEMFETDGEKRTLEGDYSIGFIAQDMIEEVPEIVSGTDGQGDMKIDYAAFTSVLTKAIQEQQVIIDDLKARIETLEG